MGFRGLAIPSGPDFAGTGTRTGETLAIRWEAIDFDTKVAYIEGNQVWIKGKGLAINDGKTAMARRPIPLADWLADLLHDRRQRIAEHCGIAAEI